MSSEDKKSPEKQVAEQTEAESKQYEERGEPVTIEVDDPRAARIAELEEKLKALYQREHDILLRARAETENIRRRAEVNVEKAHKFALEKFASAALVVIDNLERALEAADRSNQSLSALIEGVELTLKSLLDTFHKFGIEVISEVNVPFNPEIHQAMTMLESAEHAPNSVIMVMQKGYTLNGRLLRPSMVAVSKAKG